ncbi:hypothetical protein V6N13_005879 [Hibiscus sabdariffa]
MRGGNQVNAQNGGGGSSSDNGFLINGNSEERENGKILKKRSWTATEDMVLIHYVRARGKGNWNAVHKNTGLARYGKSYNMDPRENSANQSKSIPPLPRDSEIFSIGFSRLHYVRIAGCRQ